MEFLTRFLGLIPLVRRAPAPSGSGRPAREAGERRRAARLAVTQALAEAGTTAEAAPRILRAVCENLGWKLGGFWVVDPGGAEVRCLELWQPPSVPAVGFRAACRQPTLRRGVGLPGSVWASGRPAWIPDVARDANFSRAAAAEQGLHGAFAFPLIAGDEVLGAVEFFSDEVREPDADLLEMAATVGALIGQFMDRRRQEEELKRLYREVSEAGRRKDEFLATLAHELRNPLAPIRNALEVMRLRGLDDPQARWARDVIERQVVQMTRLVDDLLDVSRITRDKVRLRKEVVALAGVMASAIETSRPLIKERRHELRVSMPPEPLWLEADPDRLAQILANLLNNSAKYTEPGGRIELTAAREGDAAVLRVRDTGIGISPDLLPRLFGMFVQAEHGKDRARGGLGIGLSLVRSLVEMHGGAVEAHSDGPGRGSEFVVRLPARAGGEAAGDGRAAPPRAPAPSDDRAAPPPSVRVRSILVVDDNADAADSLAMLLRVEGHEVRVAQDGPAALGAVRADPPEMVILDIGLPGMDGYEVARRIRQGPGADTIVLVALTGWGQEEDRRRSKETGFDHHLTKPVELGALLGLLAGSRPVERPPPGRH